MNATAVQKEMHSLADPVRAAASRKYFKTGKGEYGEGDKFIGVPVPQQRLLAKKYKDITLSETGKLLQSVIHEERLTALFILVFQYKKGNENLKREIVNLFLSNVRYINNWDLVDSSASYILGNWLLDKDRKIIYEMAKSKNLWERRIAIISTAEFIRHGEYNDTTRLCEILMNDKEDLIHKACGWMLREMGHKSEKLLESFLSLHAADMPRTMLRYAIEHLEPVKRKAWLQYGKK